MIIEINTQDSIIFTHLTKLYKVTDTIHSLHNKQTLELYTVDQLI